MDLSFLIGVDKGLHFKAAYVNASKKETQIDKILRYGDKVKFWYDEKSDLIPKFSWLDVVKTAKAKDALIEYFNKNYSRRI